MSSLASKEAEECSMLDRLNGPLKLGLSFQIRNAKKINTFLY